MEKDTINRRQHIKSPVRWRQGWRYNGQPHSRLWLHAKST